MSEEEMVIGGRLAVLDSDDLTGFIMVTINGEPITVRKTSSSWEEALDAYRRDDWSAYLAIAKPSIAVKGWVQGDFTVREDNVLYKGEVINDVIARRVLEHVRHGIDPIYLLRFMEKLYSNPSYNSRFQLYSFLEHEHIPITKDGNFRGYKAVRPDYYSFTANYKTKQRVLNNIGDVVSMPRSEVDDNPKNGCSAGLHVGSFSYSVDFLGVQEGHIIICEVDPENCVCVPDDSNYQKLRVCEYKVIGRYTVPLEGPICEFDSSDSDAEEQE